MWQKYKNKEIEIFFVILRKNSFAMKFMLLRVLFKNKGLRYSVYALLLFCFTACNQNIFYQKSDALPNEEWDMNNKLVYEFTISDSLQYYSFYIDVRNTNDYPYQNLHLFFTTQLPDGEIFTDTLNGVISDAYGRWTGKGSGKIRENRFVLKPKVRFQQKGSYIFLAQHAMRDTVLKGIANFGITLQYE